MGRSATEVGEHLGKAFQFWGAAVRPAHRLYNFRHRWYDPDLARFVSEDPIRLAGGINPYVFAHNNPANFRDPSGLLPCDIMLGTGACFYTELPGVTNGYGPKPAPGDEDPDYVCRTYGYCGMPSNYVPNPGGPVGRPGVPATPPSAAPPAEGQMDNATPDPCGLQVALASVNVIADIVAAGPLVRAAVQGRRLYRAGTGIRIAWDVMSDKVLQASKPGLIPAGWQFTSTGATFSGTFNSGDAMKFLGGFIPVVGSGIAIWDAVQVCRNGN